MTPRYPDVHVSIRSDNPLALASAVRLALRRAGAPPQEIRRFSDEALTVGDPHQLVDRCRDWVRLDSP